MADPNKPPRPGGRKEGARKRPRQGGAKAAAATGAAASKRRRKGSDKIPELQEPANSLKGVFVKELGDIMFAYGDTSRTPVPETADALEAVAIAFVRRVITKAFELASVRGEIDEHNIQFVLRKDPRKAHRAAELIEAQKKSKEYRAALKDVNVTVEDIRDGLLLAQDAPGHSAGPALQEIPTLDIP